MAMFNSFVKLPEGTLSDTPIWAHSIIPCVPQAMVSSEDYLRCMFLSQRDFKGAGRNDTAFMLDQVYLRPKVWVWVLHSLCHTWSRGAHLTPHCELFGGTRDIVLL